MEVILEMDAIAIKSIIEPYADHRPFVTKQQKALFLLYVDYILKQLSLIY